MFNFKVRVLTDDDWDSVFELLRPWYDEGHWSEASEFSPENGVAFVSDMLEYSDCIGCFDGSELVGLVCCDVSYNARVRPDCFITRLYSSPHVRGSGVSRLLVEAALLHARSRNCVSVYAANLTNFSDRDNTLHDNLFKKYGFGVVSNNLRKVL